MPLFTPASGGVQVGRAVGSSVSPNVTASSYADVPDMSVTLTTTGGDLHVWFEATVSMDTTSVAATVGLSIDGASEVAERTVQVAVTGDLRPCAILHSFTGVAAGSHTVKARWKSNGTASLNNSVRQRSLTVMEVKP